MSPSGSVFKLSASAFSGQDATVAADQVAADQAGPAETAGSADPAGPPELAQSGRPVANGPAPGTEAPETSADTATTTAAASAASTPDDLDSTRPLVAVTTAADAEPASASAGVTPTRRPSVFEPGAFKLSASDRPASPPDEPAPSVSRTNEPASYEPTAYEPAASASAAYGPPASQPGQPGQSAPAAFGLADVPAGATAAAGLAADLPANEWSPSSLGVPAAEITGSATSGGTSNWAATGSAATGSAATGSGASGSAAVGSGAGGWGGPAGADTSGQWQGSSSKRRFAVIAGIAAALVVLVGGGGFYVLHGSHAASSSSAGGTTKQASDKKAAPSAGPERITSVTPAEGATGVNGGAAIQVVFAEPLNADSPMPTIKPKVPGSWHVSGSTATFVPAKGFWQKTKVKVTIPAGATGVESDGGGRLAAPVTESFTTGEFSLVRLEQDLGQLGYLPLTWAQSSGTAAPLSDANAQYDAAYSPPAGTYTWESGYPTKLASLWKPDAPSEVLRGAVAAFQADHGLTEDMITENQQGLIVTGSIGHRLWAAMFKALGRNAMNHHGYTYALASQHVPETLTVWHDGKVIFHHLANTGIPVSPTAPGTNPVYIRYQNQIMRGTNPDGTKYADPVAWVAYFHAGEAVHYFPRYSYGSQQSLGCVELPYNEAKSIWPYLTYGTLVTVTKV